MQLKKLTFVSLVLMMGVHANADVRVNNVRWDLSEQTSKEFQHLTMNENAGGIVFIRPASNSQLADQSSTNLAINERYLVSLQDGHYASGVACAGDVQLSAAPTGVKINDLLAGVVHTNLSPREVQYFVVSTDSNYQPRLTRVDAHQATQLLQGVSRQAHQISRVQPVSCVSNGASSINALPVAPVMAAAPALQQVTHEPSIRLDIHFDHDKSNVKPVYAGELTKAANFLAQYPAMNAIIEGHTDSTGDDNYNQRLSQRRAEEVKKLLINEHGVDRARLSAVGYGESRPVATNNTKEGRYQNRRVMVVIPELAK